MGREHLICYQDLYTSTQEKEEQDQDLLKHHFEEIEQLTQLLNDEGLHEDLQRQLQIEKIEKRTLLAKYADHQFAMQWTEKDRHFNFRKDIGEVQVGGMPQRTTARKSVIIYNKFGLGEGLY